MSRAKTVIDAGTNLETAAEPGSTMRPWHDGPRKRVGVLAVVFAVILGGGLWYGLGRSNSISAGEIVSECSQSLTNDDPSGATNLAPTVVGRESSVGVAAFHTASGWRWCFVGMGTGTGPIEGSAFHVPVSASIEVLDGGFGHDVLMLVHHDRLTRSVVVDTASSRSVVLASADGFEVLRVPMARWPRWRAPWSRTPVVLGRILGFDSEGRLMSNVPFAWCPGSIDVNPGQGC